MITFQGGAPFEGHDDDDRDLLARSGASTVAVLPTADAMENPSLLVDAATAWSARVGASGIDAVMVLQRSEATEDAAARIRDADAVWVVGDSPLHLRSVLKDTPVLDAVRHHAKHGVLVAVGASAATLCDPMIDPRGGAFTLGLGIVPGLALVTESENWTDERLARTCELAEEHGESCLVLMPTASSLTNDGGSWVAGGGAEVVVGELP